MWPIHWIQTHVSFEESFSPFINIILRFQQKVYFIGLQILSQESEESNRVDIMSIDRRMFKVLTVTTYEYPTQVEVPDVDIRIPISYLINISELYLRYPKEMVHLCQFVEGDENLTVNTAIEFHERCSDIRYARKMTSALSLSFIAVGDVEQLTLDPSQMVKKIAQKKLCWFESIISSSSVHDSTTKEAATTTFVPLGNNNNIFGFPHRVNIEIH
ncbi:uncharacterized protein LOC128389255 [Panonychus citri]|uniref:uncharacterized protein LOC128389255 n=1 Tax=Panonychus citri TaxID=50023 RepID=UPI00230771A9|nr:uncharacterized protein LOC128389255 [Panonychus citri]